jgi:hypothetical protein
MSNPLIPVAAVTEETLQLAKTAFDGGGDPTARPLRKTYDTSLNLIGVNLEAPSKKLFPVYSPLRNKISRQRAPNGASATTWKAITAINTSKIWPGVSEGNRNSKIVTATEDKSATFKELGLDDEVTFKAINRARNFEDLRATASINLLYAVMIDEEKVLLGGQATDIGAPSAPTAVADVGGGSLAAGTYTVKISALVLRGYDKAEKAGGAALADGESDASAASAGIVLAGPSDALDVTWPAKKGAVAYNVFVDKDGGGYKYQSTVFVNDIKIQTYTALTAAPNATDETGNALEFTGIIGSIETDAALPATQFVDQGGAALTSDTAGGIVEFDDVLKSMWDNFRVGPDEILVNSAQARDITKLIGSSSNLSYRVVLQDGQRNVVGGIYVGAYLNKFASSFAEGVPNEVTIKIHPNLPPGTILFVVHRLPYPNNQVPNVWEVETLQEYTHYDFALTARKYEFGIYHDEVLKGYYSACQAAIVCVS